MDDPDRENLRRLVHRQGYDHVARQTGFSVETLRSWLHGRREPRASALAKLRAYYERVMAAAAETGRHIAEMQARDAVRPPLAPALRKLADDVRAGVPLADVSRELDGLAARHDYHRRLQVVAAVVAIWWRQAGASAGDAIESLERLVREVEENEGGRS